MGAVSAWGQQVTVNSSPSPVGSGARALGMGGAFVAIADDATAASWNPGGLTQLERPEFSYVYSWKWASEDFATTPFIFPDDGTFNIDLDSTNFFSVVYPIPRTIGGRNLVLSLSYQRKFDFDRSLDFRARRTAGTPVAGPAGYIVTDFNQDVQYRQKGGLATISPALGFEITNRLSVGIVAHIWDSDLLPNNEWETETRFKLRTQTRSFNPALNAPPTYAFSKSTDKFTGYEATNYTIGALYKPNDRWGIGVVYHTRYTAKVDRENVTRNIYTMGAMPTAGRITHSKLEFDWPAAAAVGVSYRFPNDKLTLSLDVTRIDWDDFVKKIKHAAMGSFILQDKVSPITGLPKSLSPHDPTWTLRLGGEYVFVQPRKPKQNYLPSVRAGLFYDPEPAGGRKDSFWGPVRGDGEADDYYGFAFGAGVLIRNRVNIDAAYQYRWGNNVERDTLAGGFLETDFDEDVRSHTLSLSTVIYF